MSDSSDESPFELTPPSRSDENLLDADALGQNPQSVTGDGDQSSAADRPAVGKTEAMVRWKEEPDDSDEGLAQVNFGAGKDREALELDMTPMVDVTFLLLIFFMVTASFTLLKTIEQPAPNSEEPSMTTVEEFEDNPDYVLVFIDEFNTYTVVYGDLEQEAPSEQELYVQLREAMNGAPIQPTKLMVKAHGDASHERVVIAMDAGTDVGLTETEVMLTEQDAL
jgi:biopolymer transport protein ExbD